MTPAALARRPEKISSPSLVLYRRGEIIYNLALARRLIVATKQTQWKFMNDPAQDFGLGLRIRGERDDE
jgi:hypothetical protein